MDKSRKRTGEDSDWDHDKQRSCETDEKRSSHWSPPWFILVEAREILRFQGRSWKFSRAQEIWVSRFPWGGKEVEIEVAMIIEQKHQDSFKRDRSREIVRIERRERRECSERDDMTSSWETSKPENENKGISITGSHEVPIKTSTDGTASAAGKVRYVKIHLPLPSFTIWSSFRAVMIWNNRGWQFL